MGALRVTSAGNAQVPVRTAKLSSSDQWRNEILAYEALATRRELVAALDWLPLPVLILAGDGKAVAANQAWGVLSGAQPASARGDGWLGVVEPADRDELLTSLRIAASDSRAGFTDSRLAGVSGPRLSRWWWRPGPADHLIVCVADLEREPRSTEIQLQGSRPDRSNWELKS
jgi:PAS domain-containing protein